MYLLQQIAHIKILNLEFLIVLICISYAQFVLRLLVLLESDSLKCVRLEEEVFEDYRGDELKTAADLGVCCEVGWLLEKGIECLLVLVGDHCIQDELEYMIDSINDWLMARYLY